MNLPVSNRQIVKIILDISMVLIAVLAIKVVKLVTDHKIMNALAALKVMP